LKALDARFFSLYRFQRPEGMLKTAGRGPAGALTTAHRKNEKDRGRKGTQPARGGEPDGHDTRFNRPVASHESGGMPEGIRRM